MGGEAGRWRHGGGGTGVGASASEDAASLIPPLSAGTQTPPALHAATPVAVPPRGQAERGDGVRSVGDGRGSVWMHAARGARGCSVSRAEERVFGGEGKGTRGGGGEGSSEAFFQLHCCLSGSTGGDTDWGERGERGRERGSEMLLLSAARLSIQAPLPCRGSCTPSAVERPPPPVLRWRRPPQRHARRCLRGGRGGERGEAWGEGAHTPRAALASGRRCLSPRSAACWGWHPAATRGGGRASRGRDARRPTRLLPPHTHSLLLAAARERRLLSRSAAECTGDHLPIRPSAHLPICPSAHQRGSGGGGHRAVQRCCRRRRGRHPQLRLRPRRRRQPAAPRTRWKREREGEREREAAVLGEEAGGAEGRGDSQQGECSSERCCAHARWSGDGVTLCASAACFVRPCARLRQRGREGTGELRHQM